MGTQSSTLALSATLVLVLLSLEVATAQINSQINSLCLSQFALANQECSVMPPDPKEETNSRGEGSHYPRASRDCCRWLEEVENECVCEALRRLPPFLHRPKHTYMISVGDTCTYSYRCEGT